MFDIYLSCMNCGALNLDFNCVCINEGGRHHHTHGRTTILNHRMLSHKLEVYIAKSSLRSQMIRCGDARKVTKILCDVVTMTEDIGIY